MRCAHLDGDIVRQMTSEVRLRPLRADGRSGECLYVTSNVNHRRDRERRELADTKKLTLSWGKCGDDKHWCDFAKLDLTADLFANLKGVYIIWSRKQVVRLGSGIIKDRITVHRKDQKITAYKKLKTTWAKVNASQMEGVEKYLADKLNPAIGEAFPDRTPIPVNLPW